MNIAEMSNVEILNLWSETCESRKKGSWMTYSQDTAIIEKCIAVLAGRGYFAEKAKAKDLAPQRGANGNYIEID